MSSSIAEIQDALATRDPETLVGPLFFLFTQMARQGGIECTESLRGHLLALALHPSVAIEIRLMAGAIAAELAPRCDCATRVRADAD